MFTEFKPGYLMFFQCKRKDTSLIMDDALMHYSNFIFYNGLDLPILDGDKSDICDLFQLIKLERKNYSELIQSLNLFLNFLFENNSFNSRRKEILDCFLTYLVNCADSMDYSLLVEHLMSIVHNYTNSDGYILREFKPRLVYRHNCMEINYHQGLLYCSNKIMKKICTSDNAEYILDLKSKNHHEIKIMFSSMIKLLLSGSNPLNRSRYLFINLFSSTLASFVEEKIKLDEEFDEELDELTCKKHIASVEYNNELMLVSDIETLTSDIYLINDDDKLSIRYSDGECLITFANKNCHVTCKPEQWFCLLKRINNIERDVLNEDHTNYSLENDYVFKVVSCNDMVQLCKLDRISNVEHVFRLNIADWFILVNIFSKVVVKHKKLYFERNWS
jgi:hypothetical protein